MYTKNYQTRLVALTGFKKCALLGAIFGVILFANTANAQLSKFMGQIDSTTNLNQLKSYMTPLLDSLKQVQDSAAYYAGGGEFKPYMRFLRFWEPRLGADGTFEQYYKAQETFYTQSQYTYQTISNNPWKELGPTKDSPGNSYPYSSYHGIGPFECISFFDDGTPASTSHMLAASIKGGLFYSVNAGETWQNAGTDTKWNASGCSWASFHPTNHAIWFAVSTQDYLGYIGGVYRTSDHGANWNQIGDKNDFGGIWDYIFKVIVDPDQVSSKILYVVARSGVYRTTDWTIDNPVWTKVLNYKAYDVEIKPTDNSVLYATVWDNSDSLWKIKQSTDKGLSWGNLATQPSVLFDDKYDPGAVNYAIEVSKARPNCLYCVETNETKYDKVYYIDLAQPNAIWVYVGTTNTQFGQGGGFGVDQVLGGQNIIVSDYTSIKRFNLTSGQIPGGSIVHADVEDVVFHPYNAGEVWLASHGGTEKSTNNGLSFSIKCDGQGVAMVEGIASSFLEPADVLFGCMHNGSSFTTDATNPNGPANWQVVEWGDGFPSLINPKEPSKMLVCWQKSNWRYSEDKCQTSMDLPTETGWQTTGVLNKVQPNIFYVNNWIVKDSPFEEMNRIDLNSPGFAVNDRISNFKDMFPTAEWIIHWLYATPWDNPNYLLAFVIQRDTSKGNLVDTLHLFRTTNALAPAAQVVWNELETPSNNSYLQAIEFTPSNPDLVYLMYGKSANTSAYPYAAGQIFKADYTAPQNPVFTDISKNLPYCGAGYGSLAYELGSNGGLFMATDFGVFYTNNAYLNNTGTEWQMVGTGLPNVKCNGIQLNYYNNTIRVGTNGRGVWELPIPCVSDFLTQISTNTTWNSVMHLDGDVTVEPGSTLIIGSLARILMPSGSKIIVKPGAKLLVNGGTITKGCNSPWQGIEVWGNSSAHQYPTSGTYAQGYVELNNATIENAACAVALWKPNDYAKTGGILRATNSHFINNAKAIHCGYYTNKHPVTGLPTTNLSFAKNCTFTINESYVPNFTFYKHIDLAKTNGFQILGCDFSIPAGPTTGISAYSHAIAAYDAGFTVNAPCANTTMPCTEWDVCNFHNFYEAVLASRESSAYTFSIARANFYNNAIGVAVIGVKNESILFSHFYLGPNITDNCPAGNASYGIDLYGSNGFVVEENTFQKMAGAPTGTYVGIRCKESNTSTDVIYNNQFTGISFGNYAEGRNCDLELYQNGLEYRCNQNQNNAVDFMVANGSHSRISAFQGSDFMEAGNTFSADPIQYGNFRVESGQTILYYYNTTPPVYYSPSVNKVYCNNANACPSRYNGAASSFVVLPETVKAQKELDFAINLNNYNNVKALHDGLLDGGNTQALTTEVEASTPSEMWQLRAELLGRSPHLSTEVLMAAADRTEVLPESVLFEILSANPDELRNEELLAYLENKEQPLPDYMISILRQLAGGTSYRTVLQQDMARYHADKTMAALELVRSALADTVVDYQYIRNWYDNLNNLEADYQIVDTYLGEQNYEAALAMLELIPTTRDLTGDALADFNNYADLCLLLIQWAQQGIDLAQSDSATLETLLAYACLENSHAAPKAKAILGLNQAMLYDHCLPYALDLALKRGALHAKPVDNGLSCTANPNPASTWVAFDFKLPIPSSTGLLLITDMSGKAIASFNLTMSQGQQVWDTRGVEKGTYLYVLKAGNASKQGKVVIH